MDQTTLALLERVRNFAMPGGPVQCQRTRLRQTGEMRMAPDGPWLPFKAEQTFSAVGLDFRWEAHARIARWMPAKIIDAVDADRGVLSVRLFGILPIARFRGPALDKGAVIVLPEVCGDNSHIPNVSDGFEGNYDDFSVRDAAHAGDHRR